MKVAACLCMEVPSAYGLFPQFGSTFCAGGRGGGCKLFTPCARGIQSAKVNTEE